MPERPTDPWTSGVEVLESHLLRRAEQETGLSDWDEAFRPHLRRLLNAILTEADLNAEGRRHFEEECVRWLSNRLKLRGALEAAPTLAARPVTRPVFILGLPRTGTTMLHRLLAADPRWRVGELWELVEPAPPPVDREGDPRIERMRDILKGFLEAVPEHQSMHYLGEREPEECYLLLQNTFLAYGTGFDFNIPSYERWILQQDLRASFREYADQLRVLQAHRPEGRWLLKNPGHILALDAINAVFPDAQFVLTRRDPTKIMGSICSLQAAAQAPWQAHPPAPKTIGPRLLERWREPARRLEESLQRLDPARVCEVQFPELMTDPLSQAERIYEAVGVPWTSNAAALLSGHLAANPRHKHGRHRYTLERFGLQPQDVHDALDHQRS